MHPLLLSVFEAAKRAGTRHEADWDAAAPTGAGGL